MTRAVLVGAKELKAALRSLDLNAQKELAAVINITAQGIRTTAIRSVQSGAKTGVVYDKTNPRRSHRASAPGEAPATDTGRLVGSIKADVKRDIAEVSANTVYAAALEFGTSNMEARPFLIPAMENERPAFDRRLRQVIDKATKGTTR